MPLSRRYHGVGVPRRSGAMQGCVMRTYILTNPMGPNWWKRCRKCSGVWTTRLPLLRRVDIHDGHCELRQLLVRGSFFIERPRSLCARREAVFWTGHSNAPNSSHCSRTGADANALALARTDPRYSLGPLCISRVKARLKALMLA